MVYAELKLERKVDWNTYPTTMQYLLCIGKTVKDIPDMYIPESAATKGILGFLRKKLQGTTDQGSSSKKEATSKARPVRETSNHVLQEPNCVLFKPLRDNVPMHPKKRNIEKELIRASKSIERKNFIINSISNYIQFWRSGMA
jgi:hypothetical protein